MCRGWDLLLQQLAPIQMIHMPWQPWPQPVQALVPDDRTAARWLLPTVQSLLPNGVQISMLEKPANIRISEIRSPCRGRGARCSRTGHRWAGLRSLPQPPKTPPEDKDYTIHGKFVVLSLQLTAMTPPWSYNRNIPLLHRHEKWLPPATGPPSPI